MQKSEQLFFLTNDDLHIKYREKMRSRAIELVDWILDSGDGKRLGLTREDVQTPIKQIKWGKYRVLKLSDI